MEEYAGITRFILTANYKHRVIPALQSRCQSFDLTPPLELCVERVLYILEKENISTTGHEELLEKFIKVCYPDLRKCINEVQQSVIDLSLIHISEPTSPERI